MITLPTDAVTVFFASPLEAECIAQIRDVSPRLELLVPTDLWPKVRYPADHFGEPLVHTPEQEARWLKMLARAEVCFDFDRWHLANLPRLAPRLRWIQSTSAGVVHYVEQSGADQADILVTTAAGVHAVPLAEWVLAAVLWHEKRLPHLQALRTARHWERFCGGEAHGKTACVVGYGQVGRAVGRYLEAIGVDVFGFDSKGLVKTPDGLQLPGASSLDAVLPISDYLVLAAPGTAVNRHLVDRRRLSLLPRGALVVNVGRGTLVEEPALIELLEAGQLGGAALDVFAVEPLPSESPLWSMSNVLINPHSASTAERENWRITEIFCDNLRRYLADEPLRNVFCAERGY